MRIAHLSDCYLPRLGGIETQVRALATRQHDAGDDVAVITATPGHDGVVAGTDHVDGLPVHRVAMRLPLELPVHPRTGPHVTRLLTDHPVDVVHVHSGVVSPFAWAGLRAARRLGVPVLVTVHSVWGPGAVPAYRLADALLAWSRWGAALSAVSGVAADRIRAVVGDRVPVLVVPNGIDPDLWRLDPAPGAAGPGAVSDPAPGAAGPGAVSDPGPAGTAAPVGGPLRVVSVMRLAPRKRVLPLLRVLAAAAHDLADDRGLRAVVIGDGPERARAERFAAAHGLAGIVGFPGRLDRDGIREAFARADAFLQPSVRESFGLAALEARTAGLPVVARSQTGTTEFVRDGVEGLLADDDAGLARALVRLGRDPGLCAAIAAHNRGVTPDQAWPRVLAQVRAAYAVAADVR